MSKNVGVESFLFVNTEIAIGLSYAWAVELDLKKVFRFSKNLNTL